MTVQFQELLSEPLSLGISKLGPSDTEIRVIETQTTLRLVANWCYWPSDSVFYQFGTSNQLKSQHHTVVTPVIFYIRIEQQITSVGSVDKDTNYSSPKYL
jgi:hypothetical protein